MRRDWLMRYQSYYRGPVPVINKRAKRAANDQAMMYAVVATVDSVQAAVLVASEEETKQGRQPGSINVKRERRDIKEHFASLGAHLFRRMYRMHEEDFDLLYEILLPALPVPKKRSRGATPNGDISNKARLAMALRFCAGGDKHDIAATHVVHPNEVYKSLWLVVDAINNTPSMKMEFPADHDQQQKLADEFAANPYFRNPLKQQRDFFLFMHSDITNGLVW